MKIGKRRVYIAGPMTGIANYNREAFEEAAKRIAETTRLIPVHTAWLELGYDYEDYIQISLDMLIMCHLITTLPGWEGSIGAQREMRMAERQAIPHVALDDLMNKYPKTEY